MKLTPFIFTLLLSAIWAVACGEQQQIVEQKNNEQATIRRLGVDTMTAIMTELQLVEAAVGLAPLNYASQMARYKKYEQEIFDKYKTDSAKYFESYTHYAKDPKLLKKMYTTVFDTIMLRKARVDTVIKKMTGAVAVPLSTTPQEATVR